MAEIKRKTALITGASRGIGAACARALAAGGMSVAINYNKSEAAALALREELRGAGVSAVAVRADVASHEECAAMARYVLSQFGHIDALVCCAGVARQQLFTDITPQDWRGVMSVDLDGVYNSIHAVLPHMIARKSGSIVTIASMWGQVGASCEAHYSAAKAGVIGLSKALAKELGPSGVRVNCLCPGAIETDMLAGFDEAALQALRDETPLGRLGTPQDVARAARFLAGDEAGFITGQVLGVNGGMVI